MRSWIYPLATACLLACSAAQAKDTTPTPSVNERLQSAQKAIQAKDWRRAQTELNAALRDEPRNADIHNLLGYTARKSSPPHLPEAFAHYKTALEINPQHRGAHEYLGEAYLMDKQPAEAQKQLAALEKICGNQSCEEYADLAKAIADYKASNP
ncbi:tetratricopeptide repeat protein [Rhodoferax sp.]|uniref:tetratricopeptide repeat protein n=1 Tax=Rhodoferax sp. TaxID=50421 RepID=UPI0025EA0A00|nr:tetratricopeptide repeat protein [Rhodoferax sp.]